MKLFRPHKNISLLACLAAVMVLALAPKASALSEVQTGSWSEVGGAVDQTFTFDKFDDQGGSLTLESVKLRMDLSSYDGHLEVTNKEDKTQSSTIEFGYDGVLARGDDGLESDGALMDGNFNSIANDLESSHESEERTLDGEGDTVTYAPETTASDHGEGYVADSQESQYVGTGTFDLTADLSSFREWDFEDVEYSGEDPDNDGSITVTYNYTPEPTSLFLLLMTSGIAILFNRRRR